MLNLSLGIWGLSLRRPTSPGTGKPQPPDLSPETAASGAVSAGSDLAGGA